MWPFSAECYEEIKFKCYSYNYRGHTSLLNIPVPNITTYNNVVTFLQHMPAKIPTIGHTKGGIGRSSPLLLPIVAKIYVLLYSFPNV